MEEKTSLTFYETCTEVESLVEIKPQNYQKDEKSSYHKT